MRPRPSRRAFDVGMGLVGLVAVALMLRGFDPRQVWDAARALGPWVPALVALEGARILLETGAGRALYAALDARPSPRTILRAYLWGYAVSMAMPAGRALSEAGKAAVLSRHVGGARGASVGAVSQALGLVATGIASVPCALAALRHTGPSHLTVAITLQGVFVGGAGIALLVLARHPALASLVARRAPTLGMRLEAVQGYLRAQGAVPWRPLAWLLANRALEFAQFAVLLRALGALAPARVMLAQGAMLVGEALGDVVPGQLGATDAALAFAAPVLGIERAQGLALALAFHGAQAVWVLTGALVPVLWREAALS